jgi:pimeloyl-ACP methyl ester carboxylesterase
MEYINSIDGTKIGYQRGGTGSPLLLVHGTSADHRRWSKVLPHFERHFAVYAMDRRGRGGSGDSVDYDLMREAEDVAAVVDAAGEQSGKPVCLLGHSYGAVCSLEAALLTDNLSQLILYEPPLPTGLPMYAPDVPDRIQSLVDSGDFEAALEVHFREIVKMPEHELEVYRSLPMWQGRIQLAPTLTREMEIDQRYRFEAEKFANFQIPTLLLLGSDSPPIFRRAIDTLDSTLPNSRVVEMPGQQHIAMDTNPELFVREVLHYLGVKQSFS